MNNERAAKIAKRIVGAIERDISDRRGLKQEWYEIDDDIKNEIRSKWQEIVINEIRKE